MNRGIFIAGVRNLTQNTILSALEMVTGTVFTIERVNLAPIKERALAALTQGDLAQAIMGLTINSNFNEAESKADFWDRVENELVGVEAVTVEAAVRAALSSRHIQLGGQ